MKIGMMIGMVTGTAIFAMMVFSGSAGAVAGGVPGPACSVLRNACTAKDPSKNVHLCMANIKKDSAYATKIGVTSAQLKSCLAERTAEIADEKKSH